MNPALLATTMRRVATRWRRTHATAANFVDLATILAASTLPDGSELPEWNASQPRPSLQHSLQLVDLLEDELLALGGSGASPPAQVLHTVARLRRVRAAIERRFQELPGAPLVSDDGLEFLAEFVHDLRSPLDSLQLLANRLQQGQSGPLSGLQQSQLRLIYAAAHALTTLTSNALQITRESDELEERDARPFSVTRLLSDVQEIVRALAVRKGIAIAFVRPSADRRSGHTIELQRILLNLVTNALKFTTAGTITVSATDQTEGRVEFAVQDTGPGIDATMRDTLFQPFRRVGGHVAFSATRLGLAITQRLVRALGGELSYETAAATGTRFHFAVDLPVA